MSADLGFFKDRILANVTYYRARTSDQLAASPLAPITGFTSVTENVPSTVQNKGWEFGLNTRNIESSSFGWRTSFNLTFNRNKLLSFPNLASSPSYRNNYTIGQPISYIGALKFAGLDPATGLPTFFNRSGEVISGAANISALVLGSPLAGGDYIANINRDPDFGGGLGNSFNYKQFRLDFFLQYNSQTQPNWKRTLYLLNRLGQNANNVPAAVLGNYWQNPGDQTELLKLTAIGTSDVAKTWAAYTASDTMYEKARYVRLKTVALSYSLPTAFVQKLHVKGATFTLNAQNLFVISNVEVGDPESNGAYFAIPMQRIVSFGANFNF